MPYPASKLVYPYFQDELDQFRDISDQAAVDADVAAIVRTLWADAGIQQAFSLRNKFQLHDSAA